jgi:hypothetical protein
MGTSRITDARRRAQAAKRAAAVAAVAGFGLTFGLIHQARATAQNPPSTGDSQSSSSAENQSDDGFFGGGSSISPPNGGAPSVGTGTS